MLEREVRLPLRVADFDLIPEQPLQLRLVSEELRVPFTESPQFRRLRRRPGSVTN